MEAKGLFGGSIGGHAGLRCQRWKRIQKNKSQKPVWKSHTDCPYCRCDWISISLRSWCSSPSFSSWDLKRTFRATMKWLSLSRARYTFPNFPLPRGRPISKSSIVRRHLTGGGKKSLSLTIRWRRRVRVPECSPSSSTLTLPLLLSLRKGPARVYGQ